MNGIQAINLSLITSLFINLIPLTVQKAWGLPPKEDVPEEVLRTEIITEARSPIDGKLLSAAEYAQLQAQLQSPGVAPLDPKIRETIFLLRIRQLFRSLGIPIR
ncbi:hypothetical protein Cri9333_1718 [Crinalium epipsammum PCC 9333]|uniref:Glutathione S-transferase n=1 Tax=Crinalium epipsammum PCC 9333 TaxID=1173022 RepID=K9VZM6_9CYAN|nr:hypothetical protein [Crinalium epipsammum]AFZ12605.1 hypothetical protein Cri9333_1718 [Crinalium epipsammum PCC 9333]